MGRGSYLGGCTVIGPRSGWFSGAGRGRAQKERSPAGPAAPNAAVVRRERGNPHAAAARQQLQQVRLHQAQLRKEAADARRRADNCEAEASRLEEDADTLIRIIRRLERGAY